ncbi:hypothetical protein H0264_33350 [Nocardia huaxiensis]|uniref:Uncharacterized protein n=1 Tax=Nocardia huaxiensis TaxID=2755382 RepID=A0A7D6ZS83_9NOCA|nr:hypothetical protein [Nocardia huaxiensis]QLY27529.1 hypothetical protein H0264_33350 [Nocardia huaxiensis]
MPGARVAPPSSTTHRRDNQPSRADPPADTMMYLFDCTIDPGDLALPQAHQAMQIHKCCTVDNCLIRRRARQILVDTGQMVLDERAAL